MREMLNSKESWFRSSKTKVLMPEAHAFLQEAPFRQIYYEVTLPPPIKKQDTIINAISSFIALDFIEKMSKFLRASVTYS